jgi:hypothetical protein
MRRRLGLVFFVVALVAGSAWGQLGIRNISSAHVDIYLNNAENEATFGGALEKYALDINQVLLFRVTSWLSGEVKVQRQDEEPIASPVPNGWRETTISVAPIFVVTPFNYIIVRYGLGIGSGYERPVGEALADSTVRGLSHDVTVDANYETAQIYANLTLRASFYPDLDYWFLLPSTAFTYNFASGLSLGGRYFFSYNSNETLDHAVKVETSYRLLPAVTIRAGGIAGFGPSQPSGEQWRYGGLLGANFTINESLALRYQLDVEARAGQGPRIGNTLVLDARF